MNEPLKHKLFSIDRQILNYRKLEEAWKYVEKNHGDGGVGEVSIEKFEKNQD